MDKVTKVRKSGLTFAPEAGTQRLRDAINKNVTEEELIRTCTTAFEGGYTTVKLYFMMGLPSETMEDIKGIADTAQRIVQLFYDLPNKPKGKGVQVSISCASFVPKPFTPFEFEPQDTGEELAKKQKYLLDCTRSNKMRVSYHDVKTSLLEAVLARGDRRLAPVIEHAWRNGCNFDGWGEHLKHGKWVEAMEACNIDMSFYANRKREYDEIMPWDHLDYGVSKEFLVRENKACFESLTTPHCRDKCSGCTANKFLGGPCFND